MASKPPPKLLVWIDLETTGLDPLTETVLEVGIVITDLQFREKARSEWLLRLTPEFEAAHPLDPVVRQMHEESGLLALCRAAQHDAATADYAIAQWLKWQGVDETCPLAGQSVGDFDRHFLRVSLPLVAKLVSHRSVNVSTFKTLFHAWYPEIAAPKVGRTAAHRSLEDCLAAINELRYWLNHSGMLQSEALRFTSEQVADSVRRLGW